MVRLNLYPFLLLALAMLVSVPSAWAQTVRAYVDRNPISMDETVRLVVEQQGQITGDAPILSSLENDFDVLGTSQSSQTSIINGRTSTSKQWIITLAPRQAGKVTIPPIEIGGQSSEPLMLVVQEPTQGKQGAAGKDIFLEATVEPKDPYVQSQIVYTLRLFHAVPLREGQIEDPQINQAVVERVGEDHAYETIKDGRRYKVIERRYLVVPQASGSLKVPSVLFSGQVPDGRQPRSMFEDMFGTRSGVFGGNFQSTRRVRARTPEITLNVREIPPEMKSGTWLPARELSLTEAWSTDSLDVQVGEPLTRTITIHVKGVTGEQLPELTHAEDDHVKIYPEQPTITTSFDGSWAVGTREQKLALVPTKPGRLNIPEIRIRWWDLETQSPEEAVLPARAFNIVGSAASTAPSSTLLDKEEMPTSVERSSFSGNEGNPAHKIKNNSSVPSSLLTQWPLLTSMFLLMWLLTMVGWWYDRKTHRSKMHASKVQNEEHAREALRTVRESVKRACLENSPKRTQEALLKWASVVWQESSLRSLDSVAKKFRNQVEKSNEVQGAIGELDRNLYAADSTPWNGKEFWEIIASDMKSIEKIKGTPFSREEKGLAPLYLPARSS